MSFFSRRYDESIKQNRKMLDMEARFICLHDLSTAGANRQTPEAITELQKALSLEPKSFVLSLWA